MSELIQNYSKIIEKVRKDRKISRDELCEDIMSKRNYQRFATGDISISSNKLLKLTDRLMLDTYSLQEYNKTDNQDEYLKLKKAFNYATQGNEIEAKRLIATTDFDNINSIVNKQLYNFVNLLISRRDKKIHEAEFYKKLESIIDFPEILNKNYINSTELSGLSELMIYEIKQNKNNLTEFFVNLLKNNQEPSYWLTNEIRTSIMANLAKAFFLQKNFEKCLEYCEKGLITSNKTNRFIALISLLGHKALSLHKLGLIEESIETAAKLYMHVLVEGDENKISFVKNLLKRKLDLDITEVVKIKKEV